MEDGGDGGRRAESEGDNLWAGQVLRGRWGEGGVETLQDGSNGFDDDDRSGLKEEGPSRKCCLLKGQ